RHRSLRTPATRGRLAAVPHLGRGRLASPDAMSARGGRLRKPSLALLARAALGHLFLVLAHFLAGRHLFGLAFVVARRRAVGGMRRFAFGALGVAGRLLGSRSFVAHAFALPVAQRPRTQVGADGSGVAHGSRYGVAGCSTRLLPADAGSSDMLKRA